MGSILDSIIEEIKESDFDVKLTKICDQILEEEKDSIKNPDKTPKGTNVILALQVPPYEDNVTFLTLERFMNQQYIICVWKGNEKLIKIKSVNVREPDEHKKILKEYAQHYKIMKGGI